MGKGPRMDRHALGNSGLEVTRIGYGAFKIGRNVGAKYPDAYELPGEDEAAALLNEILDLGIALVDTAPAYGLSEQRVGKALSGRRSEFTLSTKVGETFQDGQSTWDFRPEAMEASLQRSLQRLQCDTVDLLLVHSDGRDLDIQAEHDVSTTMQRFKDAGMTRAIGFSGKTEAGLMEAIQWADAIMVEYHLQARELEPVIHAAGEQGVGVLVKKGLGSGHLDPEAALHFLLEASPVRDAISSIVIGSLSSSRMAANIDMACSGS